MNQEDLIQWLDATSSDPGIWACGLRFPDTNCLSRSFRETWTAGRLDQLWNHLAEIVKAFTLRRMPVDGLCWKFQDHHVRLVLRNDGLVLGLILDPDFQNRPEVLQAILNQFGCLSLGDDLRKSA